MGKDLEKAIAFSISLNEKMTKKHMTKCPLLGLER